ncbi:MAG TPA: hypothetical protein VK610_00505, partial [Rhodothermales bacterium]|nr:hypothetical protein [Rhodothermales bacterium]
MSRSRYSLAGVLAAVLVAVAPAPRAQSFQGLGDLAGGIVSSNAFDVSDDGTVVTGSSQTVDGGRAYRWTATGGMVNLGTILNLAGSSFAYGISGSGGTIVGQSPWSIGNTAFRWTAGEGMVQLPGGTTLRAEAASSSGAVIIGRRNNGAIPEAFRWTQAGGLVGLGDLPGGSTASYGNDVSADGNIIVGYSFSTSGVEAFRWAGSIQGLGDLPGGNFSSVAWGISAGGGLIVGGSSSADLPGGQAFIWSQAAGGMDALDFITGAVQATAYAVSDDGQRIVGFMSLPVGIRAVIWAADGNVRLLQDVLVADYGLNLDGWTLEYAESITPDGRVVVGSGRNPAGQPEGWIAVLGPPADDQLVVNDTRDLADPDVDDDRCDVDPVAIDRQCTLRAAIETANAREGRDSVAVNIEGAGVHTIALATPLPAVEEPIVLDARTQPGYVSTPLVAISGTLPTALLLSGGESTVRGFAIGGFSAAGISITGPGENRVEACHLGVDPAGTAALPNAVGVLVTDSPDNVIGGATAPRRNLISGNTEAGVQIVGAAATGTIVVGNYVGLNVAGTAALPNVAAGIVLEGAPGVRVGGPTAGERNVIAGNPVGVEVSGAAEGTVIQGNYLGLAPTGQTPLPNAVGVRARGAIGLVVGAAEAPNRFLATAAGVLVTATDEGVRSTGTRVEGNVFGLLADGTAPTGSPAGAGVVVERADGTVIGGAASAPGTAPGNHFGRLNAAVRVQGNADGGAAGTRVAGNLIGLDATGAEARTNGVGVWVQGAATGTRVGGWATGERNVIAGNGTGVAVTNGDDSGTAGEPTGTVVAGNY